ncbi:MAG: SAF domain-containing protein [Oscillospiraceae bacterium]|nr:SAF domain-containing protein [Oscillospiraceae bacterium]
MLKNRTFLGILAIAAALIICFGISPLFTRAMEDKIEVVILKSPVKQGEMLSENHIAVVSMGAYNMPQAVLKTPKDVVGKYAKSNLYRGSIVIPDMLADEADNSDNRLRALKDNELAMAVTIKSFAEGFSGKLLPGDIIMIVSVKEDKTAVIYDELMYIEILTTTTKDGTHTEGNAARETGVETDLPVTITLILQDNLQALRLAECEKTNLHAVFVCRDRDKSDHLLKVQSETLYKENESTVVPSVFEPNIISNTPAADNSGVVIVEMEVIDNE